MPIRIVIADDHRLLRAGLNTLLCSDSNLEVVGEATNGLEAIRVVGEAKPDLILLDLSMPDTNGLETIRNISQLGTGTRILVLSMHEDNALVQETLHAGASGYIIKRAAASELIDAIYAVWRGMIYIYPSLVKTMVSPVPQRVQPVIEEPEALTVREMEILRFIVKGYTNREIASLLNISVRTVESHRSNLMDKLNLHSRVDLVKYAESHGLLKADEI